MRTAIEQLTVERRGLPLTVSVGRLHPTKGMDRLARAWVGSAELHAATNLLIIGGGLEQPTADELGVLGDLDDILGDAEQRRHTGAVLLGHQPNEVVASPRRGRDGLPGLVAPGGVYVGPPPRRSSDWPSSRRSVLGSPWSPRTWADRPPTSSTA